MKLMAYFNIRTTTSVYRDYVVECDTEEEAKKLAQELAYTESPKDVLSKLRGENYTLRNDIDVNASVSPMTKENLNSISKESIVATPE